MGLFHQRKAACARLSYGGSAVVCGSLVYPSGLSPVAVPGPQSPRPYRTKPQLAWEMIVEVIQAGLPIQYIVFDTLYTAGWLTKRFNRLGLIWWGGPQHDR